MNKDFDIDKTGKRMPYSVPDGFFNELRKSVSDELNLQTEEPKVAVPDRRRKLIFAGIAALAAAACIALVVVFKPVTEVTTSMEDVEKAYANLSEADQEYMMEAYQDDVFLNEQE